MSEFWIKKDGVVAHWGRWMLLMTALATLAFYTLRLFYDLVLKWFQIGGIDTVFDPKYLLLVIPIGIIWGDSLYEKDRAANGPQAKLNLEKETVE